MAVLFDKRVCRAYYCNTKRNKQSEHFSKFSYNKAIDRTLEAGNAFVYIKLCENSAVQDMCLSKGLHIMGPAPLQPKIKVE